MKDRSIDKVIKLIENLRLQTVDKGCSEGDVQAAALSIRKLLDQYSLTLEDVETKIADRDEGIAFEPVDTKYRYCPGWMLETARVAAQCFDCRLIRGYSLNAEKGTPQRRFTFVGFRCNVVASIYFYEVMCRELPLIARCKGRELRYTGNDLTSFISSFMIAAVNRIWSRVEASIPTDPDSQAIIMAKGDAIDNAIDMQNIPVFKPEINMTNRNGAILGWEEGSRFPITRPLESGNSTESQRMLENLDEQ